MDINTIRAKITSAAEAGSEWIKGLAAEVYKNMGYIVKEVSLPSLKYAVAAYYLISSAEAASNLSRYDGIKYTHRSKKGKTYEDLIKNDVV